jgi:hypothetical protein
MDKLSLVEEVALIMDIAVISIDSLILAICFVPAPVPRPVVPTMVSMMVMATSSSSRTTGDVIIGEIKRRAERAH